MATKKSSSDVLRPANLTVAAMREAIPRLQRRLEELTSFNAENLGEDAAGEAAKALQQKYDSTLIDVFGNDTVEYHRFQITSFHQSVGPIMIAGYGGRSSSRRDTVAAYQKGVEKGARTLQTIIELFNESIGDSGQSSASPSRALASLDLHPAIADAVLDLFKGEHYANAVEDACKALDLLVKLKSKRTDPSGTELMQLVFSPKAPILRFNEQATDSEKSEQQGMMYLYAGAMLAFRNPRAHGLLDDDAEVALEIIGFVNFLAKALAKTKR